MRAKSFIIHLVVYPFDVLVSIGETDEELIRKLKKYSIEEEDIKAAMFEKDTVQGRAVMCEGNQSVLRLRTIPKTAEQHGVLAHEVFHITTFIMKKVGMKLVLLKSDEAYAYLIGYLTEEIYKRLK